MSKSSTVTVREKPVENVASAQAGALTIHGETIVVQTDQRIELVDLTNRVMEFVRRFNIREGFVSLWSMHTTCALFINEFQVALLSDIKRFLEQMVARDADVRRLDAYVVVEVGAALVALFAFPVGEPADGEQIGRLEQADAIGQVEPDAGVEFFSDFGQAGGSDTGLHLVIEYRVIG